MIKLEQYYQIIYLDSKECYSGYIKQSRSINKRIV